MERLSRKGFMLSDDAFKRLTEIEDVLGEDYDLENLKELIEADKEDRVVSKTSVLRLFNMLFKSADEQDEEDRQEDVPFATYNQTKWERMEITENDYCSYAEKENKQWK